MTPSIDVEFGDPFSEGEYCAIGLYQDKIVVHWTMQGSCPSDVV